MKTPQPGDLILFHLYKENIWTAAIHPILAQKLYANDYNSIEQKALEYTEDWAKRGRIIHVWKQIDANKNEYLKIV